MYKYALKNKNKSYKLYVGYRFELNNDLKTIAERICQNISPELMAIVKLPSNFMSMERSFSHAT